MTSFGWRFKCGGGPEALILLYHRVAELPSDPCLLCVTPERFAEQMEILMRHTHPLRLQELIRAVQENRSLPSRSVVVTFDDGYADNLSHAKPLLERFGIRATVFVTAGYLEGSREFWWDELERLVSQKSSYWSFYHRLRRREEGERQAVLNGLRDRAEVESLARPTHRILSPEELLSLAEGEWIEIGAHSMTHPVLSNLPVSAQWEEIRQSKNRLEEILGSSIKSFAYPYGSRQDYSDDTVQLVREAGFESACSNFSGLTRSGKDLFQLPRMIVRDWNGEDFNRLLEKWFGG